MNILFPSKITGNTYMEMTGEVLTYEDINSENSVGVISGWKVDGKRGVSRQLMNDISEIFGKNNTNISICNPIEENHELIQEDSGPYTKEEILSHISKKEIESIYQKLETADAVVFQGGVFCDWYEVAFAALASEKGVPMLGICAGQSEIILGTGGVIGKAKGGIDKHCRIYEEEVHRLYATGEKSLPFSYIINKDFLVNSIHSRAVEKVSPQCSDICAIDEDGNPEIVCGDKIITTRFHPEGLTKNIEKKRIICNTVFGRFRDMVYRAKDATRTENFNRSDYDMER